MMRAAASRRHDPRAGFTLVELMVGLTAGAILLGSVWVLTRSSSEFFHRESRIATTQSALRLATEQIRRDVARAGFLSHPDTSGRDTCNQPMATTNVRAVSVDVGETTAAPNPIRNDGLRLTGNYATGERYLAAGSDAARQTLRFDQSDDAFRRSFVSLDGTTYSGATFASVFAVDRQVRIETYTPLHRVFFRNITAVSDEDAPPSIVLDLPLPGPPCLDASNLTNAFIAPVVSIDYQVVDPTTVPALAKLNRAAAANGTAMDAVLLRREYDPIAGAVVQGSERIVLEYAAEFRLTALVCATLAIGNACDANQLVVEAAPEGIPSTTMQGLRFHLAARTPERDPNLRDPGNSLARGSLDEPLKILDPGGLGVGNARVRSAVFDVALVNNLP